MASNAITDALNIFTQNATQIKAAVADAKTAISGPDLTASQAGVITGQKAAEPKKINIAGYAVEPVYLFLGSLALFLVGLAIFRRG